MNSHNRKGLSNWLDFHSHGTDDDHQLEAVWDTSEGFNGNFKPDVEAGLNRFQDRLATENNTKVVAMRPRVKVFQIAATVALLVIAGLGVSMYFSSNQIAQIENTTKEGQTLDIDLVDGSLVFLNANSHLVYPAEFNGDKRLLELKGEAFFEVQKNEEKPFVVQTGNILVEVLGTSFNVRDLDGEAYSEVYVKTGKVAVTVLAENKRYTLNPGQTLVVDKESGEVVLEKIFSDNPIAWKTKVLRFKNAPLSEIFANMERVYDIKISIENEKLAKCPFTTTVRATKLRDAFKALEASCDLTFNISSPGKFKVSGDCCK